MPGKEIPIPERWKAYQYLKTGYGLRETSRLLNISTYGVRYNAERIDETKVLSNREYSDRCILMSPATKEIDELLKEYSTMSKKTIQQHLKEKSYTLTIRQIRYRIFLLGYRWKRAKKCQVISDTNRLRRAEFHQWYIGTQYKFDHHLFTDESTVRHGKGKTFCYVKEGHEIPTVGQLKHGNSVHVWGGISWNGATDVLIWDGRHRMKSDFFVSNMIPAIENAGNRLFNGEYQLIQDSSSIHVSAVTKAAFSEKDIILFLWPPQSPDFNPIEYVWRDMKEYIIKCRARTKPELVRAILAFWKTITPSYCRILIRNACRNMERSFDGLNREKETPTDKVYKN